MKIFAFLFLICSLISSVYGQEVKEKKEKFPTHFAIQVRGLVPNKFSEQKINSAFNDTITASIEQQYGFSFGGIIRRRYTERLGAEIGLILDKRYYNVGMALPDSNQSFNRRVAFTNFELPLNGLVFIKLTDKIHTNAALGFSAIYKPSSIATEKIVDNKGEFSMAGIVQRKFNFSLNAQLGFEYETERSGTIYLGGSAQIPTADLFTYYAKYTYANSNIFSAVVYDQRSPFFSVDLRFYFPTIKNKGDQPLRGPIE